MTGRLSRALRLRNGSFPVKALLGRRRRYLTVESKNSLKVLLRMHHNPLMNIVGSISQCYTRLFMIVRMIQRLKCGILPITDFSHFGCARARPVDRASRQGTKPIAETDAHRAMTQ